MILRELQRFSEGKVNGERLSRCSTLWSANEKAAYGNTNNPVHTGSLKKFHTRPATLAPRVAVVGGWLVRTAEVSPPKMLRYGSKAASGKLQCGVRSYGQGRLWAGHVLKDDHHRQLCKARSLRIAAVRFSQMHRPPLSPQNNFHPYTNPALRDIAQGFRPG